MSAIIGGRTDNQGMVVLPGFFSVAVVALMSAVGLTSVGITMAGRVVIPVSGRIVGFIYDLDAAITAGTLGLTFYINGSTSGVTTNATSGQRGKTILASSHVVAAGDSIDVRITTDAGIAGPTKVIVHPLFVAD